MHVPHTQQTGWIAIIGHPWHSAEQLNYIDYIFLAYISLDSAMLL